MTAAANTALWVLTPGGLVLARRLGRQLPGSRRFVSENLAAEAGEAQRFARLKPAVAKRFHQFQGHVFFMSAGIVVRMIAPLIADKTVDPAVVVVDDQGRHAISLLSGHLGGANDLCRAVAAALESRPVITTATDLHGVPAVELMAKEKGLAIENPAAIKHVSMALLAGETVVLSDPYRLLADRPPSWAVDISEGTGDETGLDPVGIVVDDRVRPAGRRTLVLRPATLAVGMGCNRGTSVEALEASLLRALERFHLAPAGLACLASIDLKSDEAGLLALAEKWQRPLRFFSREQLKQVGSVPNPSPQVEKHVGVDSVCEAAAILAARGGRLIVPKQRTPDTTVAVARIGSISWASDPATPAACRPEPSRS